MFLRAKNGHSPRRWLRRDFDFVPVLMVIVCAVWSVCSTAQIPKPAPPQAQPAAVTDPLGRETPRTTIEGLIRCGEREDYACIARYLQPVPGEAVDSMELAKEFHALRSRYKGSIVTLSDDPDGRVEEGLPLGQERAGVVKVGGRTTELILTRVDDPSYGKIWLVSSETVAQIPRLYADLKDEKPTLAERMMPAALAERHLLGMSLAQWLGWLLSIPASAVLAWLLAILLSVPRRMWRTVRKVSIKTIWETNLGLPLKCILAIIIHAVLVYLLEPPLLYRTYYYRFLTALLVACLAWLVSRLADKAFELAVHRRQASGRGGESILVLVQRVNRIVLVIIAFVAALALFGVNVKTTLAGLGVGGLAIALGAQKTLENLIGGVSLLMDKAVHAGDFCEIGGKLGTVEDIGLRSLRLRTLDQNLLVVPNSALAQMQFQNMKARPKLLISQNFSLRIETRAEQLRSVLEGVQRMLDEHPWVESGARIRVADVTSAAFNLELWAYIKIGDWAQFTGIRQDVILKIVEIIEASGTRLAAPTRLTYVSNDEADRSKAMARRKEDLRADSPRLSDQARTGT
jgi:MscS family membrane protein